jgi:hypothetical protein
MDTDEASEIGVDPEPITQTLDVVVGRPLLQLVATFQALLVAPVQDVSQSAEASNGSMYTTWDPSLVD